jgi:cobalt-zinc-cadmium efflux system outer membrane protein
MKYLKLVFALSFLMSTAIAQPVDSLVQEALRNNPQVKAFNYQRDATVYRASAVGALPAPTVGLEFSQIPISSANIFNDAISTNLSVSQMFMLGGKLSAMSEVEKRRGNVVEQNKASYEVQLRARIKMNYYQLWLLERQIGVQERTIALLDELVQSMQSRVLTNRMREADLLSIQAEVASERARLSEKRSRRFGLVSVLNSLMARNDLTAPVATDSVLPDVGSQGTENILAERVKRTNPSLIAMDRMKAMNEAMITSARKDLIPDVMVQAMVMRMPNGMILTGGSRSVDAIQQSVMGMPMQKTEWMYSIMASITLPFLPWSSERSTAKAEEMRSTNLGIDAERDAMQREMIASLRSALIKYSTNDSLARQYVTDILPLTKQSAKAQTIAYQNGQVPITTVLDALRMELMKHDDYFMVLMERQMALVELEMMVGAPLN